MRYTYCSYNSQEEWICVYDKVNGTEVRMSYDEIWEMLESGIKIRNLGMDNKGIYMTFNETVRDRVMRTGEFAPDICQFPIDCEIETKYYL